MCVVGGKAKVCRATLQISILIHIHLVTRILSDHLSHLLRISTLDSILHDAPPQNQENPVEFLKGKEKEGGKDRKTTGTPFDPLREP